VLIRGSMYFEIDSGLLEQKFIQLYMHHVVERAMRIDILASLVFVDGSLRRVRRLNPEEDAQGE